jgi:hypothetical protein
MMQTDEAKVVVETCVTDWHAGSCMTGVEKSRCRANLESRCKPQSRERVHRSCVFHALLVSRPRNPSYHLRAALELDTEPLDVFGDCGLITSRHFSKTVGRLVKWMAKIMSFNHLLSMIRSSATPI